MRTERRGFKPPNYNQYLYKDIRVDTVVKENKEPFAILTEECQERVSKLT